MPLTPRYSNFQPRIAGVVLLAASYFVLGKLGLRLAIVHPSATAVWPPSGIALASILLLGYWVWPGIFLGAFAVNLTTTGSFLTVTGIASGNTLEAVAGAWLVQKMAGGCRPFDTASNSFKFALFAGGVSTMIGATFGAGSLVITGYSLSADLGRVWLTWWLGDMTGDLLIAPLLILWTSAWPPKWLMSRVWETIGALCVLLIAASFILMWIPAGNRAYLIELVCTPILLWTAFRLGREAASTAAVVLSSLVVWATFGGVSLFVNSTPNTELLLLQTYVAVAAIMAVGIAATVWERKQGEIRLQEHERQLAQRTAELERANESLQQLAAVVESSSDAIIARDLAGTVISWNPAAEQMFGYTADEIKGMDYEIVVPPEALDAYRDARRRLTQGESVQSYETVRLRKDGTRFAAFLTLSPILDSAGQVRGTSTIARDITERKHIDEHLRETQKLESLGLLAGGVAHDFNNLLGGIMGNASLALETMPEASPDRALLQGILQASQRASGLTRQLLAYAGKGRFVMVKMDLSDLVREISGLIWTSIPKLVQLRLELNPNLPVIDADPSQIQQLIMNLVINGAEAIGEASIGTVLVTTELQMVDEHYISQYLVGDRVVPGSYVALEVHDTGSGMTDDVKAKIFDPFFTTKFTGRGLGLAAVRGIVKSHKGTIRVYSSPGKGSTFKVLLPAADGSVAHVEPAAAENLKGTGTILVVDDEEIVRNMAKRVLERNGYTVILAEDGKAAVEALGQRKSDICL